MIVIITRIFDNRHHYSDHLQCHKTSLVRQESIEGIGQNLTSDLLALDVRQALHHLGEITSQITTEDLLDDLFAKFCIGK